MRALVQRVKRAAVTIEKGERREIGPGLVILLGVREGDDIALCQKLAEKWPKSAPSCASLTMRRAS